MSLFPFLRHFVGAKGDQAAANFVKALVKLDPDTASQADLHVMEQDLDRAGEVIAKLRADLAHGRGEFEHISKQYHELMAAAELLQKRIDDPATMEVQRGSLTSSLQGLLERIEHMAPEIDQDKKDVDDTQALLTEAENTYQEKAQALASAKQNLDRAQHDLQRAHLEEERSQQRAAQAAVVAGLAKSPTSGLTVALDTMQQSAQEARQRATAADMKAQALNGIKEASSDSNVAAALAEVRGMASEKSLGERLAALRR